MKNIIKLSILIFVVFILINCSLESQTSVFFATISDIHIDNYGSLHILNKAIANINNNPDIQFVVVLGDISENGTVQELSIAKSCLDTLNVEYYPVPGNHDDNYNYIEVFGYPNYSIDKQYFRLILFNTNPGTNPFNIILLDWIEYEIDNAEKNIIICTHYPFMPTLELHRHPYADDIISLFNENVIAAIAGHHHENIELYYNDVYYTTTNCLSTNRTNHDMSPDKGYRIYEYNIYTKQITSVFMK